MRSAGQRAVAELQMPGLSRAVPALPQCVREARTVQVADPLWLGSDHCCRRRTKKYSVIRHKKSFYSSASLMFLDRLL